MKRHAAWIALPLALLWIASNIGWPKTAPSERALAAFGKVPVLSDGRIKPLDTVGRNALLIMHGKQTLRLGDGAVIGSTRWLADLFFNAEAADRYPTFVINNPEVLGLFGWEQGRGKHFSFADLTPFLEIIDAQGQAAANIDAAKRAPYHTAVFNLRNAVILYQRLKVSMRPPGGDDFSAVIEAAAAAAPTLLQRVVSASPTPASSLLVDAGALELLTRQYEGMASLSCLQPVPPDEAADARHGEWLSIGASLLRTIPSGVVAPVTREYALLGDAWHNGEAASFGGHVRDLSGLMAALAPRAASRASFEELFNRLQPFYQAMGLYVLAFLFLCASWLGGGREASRGAFALLLLGLAVHTFGLGARMYLQGRPPVTNLYSSAVFIGWGTVILGLLVERIQRDGIGMACASVIGFVTLIIAHHLAGSGDTLQMLQAVLDTNIWLATHVVVITLGYSAMFFAGTLAAIYVLRGVFTRSLTRDAAQSLVRMTYGVICFATLFSFVGTVLGGIWADQSWGRFWGWDPKENGALMIVLWCAITLHARLGGYIRDRGLMTMALFGNVITSFSWFGVNMLGVGLHSYGFMNRAVPWLAAFVFSQLLLMGLSRTPPSDWRSLEAGR